MAEIRKKLSPETKICVPVKADAYGHGALRIAVAALRSGVSHLAVATVQEGIELREAGIVAPILCLGFPIPEEIPALVKNELTPFVGDPEYAEALGREAAETGRLCTVHLKIDTGMGRIGCRCDEAVSVAKAIAKQKKLALGGVATHLSVSDSLAPDDISYTRAQIGRFTDSVDAIRKAGIDPGIVHAANSGAIIMYPEARFDMVRPGIIVYGYPPSSDLDGKIELKPLMELETQIVNIKKVAAGTPVSYGRTWTASEDTFIATIPVGYGDGLPRRLSPGFMIRIGDESFPVVGRICMDQCMIDIGPDPWVQKWDRVTVFGPDDGYASAKTIADAIGTIPYEITCDINKRVPRVYVGDTVAN
jgi:alanine racemase